MPFSYEDQAILLPRMEELGFRYHDAQVLLNVTALTFTEVAGILDDVQTKDNLASRASWVAGQLRKIPEKQARKDKDADRAQSELKAHQEQRLRMQLELETWAREQQSQQDEWHRIVKRYTDRECETLLGLTLSSLPPNALNSVLLFLRPPVLPKSGTARHKLLNSELLRAFGKRVVSEGKMQAAGVMF